MKKNSHICLFVFFRGTIYAQNNTYIPENHDTTWRGLYTQIYDGQEIKPQFDTEKKTVNGVAASKYVTYNKKKTISIKIKITKEN